jgi:hypothetical protein
MALYLQTDGVDDKLTTPSFAYDKVVFDVYIDSTKNSASLRYLIQAVSGTAPLVRLAAGSSALTIINGTVTGGVVNTRTTLTLTSTVGVVTVSNRIAARADGTLNFMGMNLYNIKFYNGATLVCHYDMTTGTVQDQSGTGYHATLTGGTWLDDGTGGGTGTDGSTAFDLKQSFYSDSLATADIRNVLYNDGSISFDLLLRLYQDSAAQTDTKLSFYQDGAALFDTLQEFFSDGIVGSVPFDLRFILFADNSAVYDSKQAFYTDGFSAADLTQQFYQEGGANADIKFVIYADALTNFDAKQTLYADSTIISDMAQRYYGDGAIDFDTLQTIIDDWAQYNEVIRITLNISRKQSDTLEVSLKQEATLDITQRMQSELKM